MRAAAEQFRVLDLYPGVTATLVAPTRLDLDQRVDVILYALPNGNTTAETIGGTVGEGTTWRYDIQHIGAQTRALRARGMEQAVVVYVEADSKSWPEWRRRMGYQHANRRIVELVDQIRSQFGPGMTLDVTLAAHSGGGSFIWGFIEGQDSLPSWLTRIAFLDANYSFEPRHGDRIMQWLGGASARTLVVVAYDDREILLDGKKVVSDSGGTWRATHRMISHLETAMPIVRDTLGDFIRFAGSQMEVLLHPNPDNRILHTEVIGEMNAYMHAILTRRGGRANDPGVLGAPRAYAQWVDASVVLPTAVPPAIPERRVGALTGSAFVASVAGLPREAREAAILRELLAGNVPQFLRTLQRVQTTAPRPGGGVDSISFDVMPDYLAIGSDTDFVRMPMTPQTAQAFCDAFGFVLPTARMAGLIWAAASVQLEPRPLTSEREAPATFLQHHRIIEAQLAGQRRGMLVAGMKKDIVVTSRLTERADRVAIFGWHQLSGEPIQSLYVGHVGWYVDYSHGARPIRRVVIVNGVARTYEAILADSTQAGLLSDEGVISIPRYVHE